MGTIECLRGEPPLPTRRVSYIKCERPCTLEMYSFVLKEASASGTVLKRWAPRTSHSSFTMSQSWKNSEA